MWGGRGGVRRKLHREMWSKKTWKLTAFNRREDNINIKIILKWILKEHNYSVMGCVYFIIWTGTIIRLL